MQNAMFSCDCSMQVISDVATTVIPSGLDMWQMHRPVELVYRAQSRESKIEHLLCTAVLMEIVWIIYLSYLHHSTTKRWTGINADASESP